MSCLVFKPLNRATTYGVSTIATNESENNFRSFFALGPLKLRES